MSGNTKAPAMTAAPVLRTPGGQEIIDMTQAPTRQEVAEMFGVTVTSVRKWERQGKLHSMNDSEGTARFALEEVRALQAAKDGGLPMGELDADDEDESRLRGMFPRMQGLGMLPTDGASLELSVVGKLMNLILKPRERIDEMLFRMLESSNRRTEALENRINQMTDAVQDAKDRTHEREAVTRQIDAKEQRVDTIVGRLMGTFDKLINKNGTPFLHSLTIEQLQAFLETPEIFSPEQLKAIQAVHDARAAETQNGVNAKGSIATTGDEAS